MLVLALTVCSTIPCPAITRCDHACPTCRRATCLVCLSPPTAWILVRISACSLHTTSALRQTPALIVDHIMACLLLAGMVHAQRAQADNSEAKLQRRLIERHLVCRVLNRGVSPCREGPHRLCRGEAAAAAHRGAAGGRGDRCAVSDVFSRRLCRGHSV